MPAIEIEGNLQQIDKMDLLAQIEQWYTDPYSKQPITSVYNLKSRLRNLYLQRGNPNTEITLSQPQPNQIVIQIRENLEQPVIIKDLIIKGGSKQLQGMTRDNLRQKVGDNYKHAIFQEDIKWLRQNFFVPAYLLLTSDDRQTITPILEIADITSVYPIANYTLTDIGGLGVVLGASVINPFKQNNSYRLQFKRNNIKVLGETTPNLMQDWEYIASFSTQNTPNEQMVFGGDIFNKVDYIFDHFRGQRNVHTWISNQGFDLFTGFPVWTNPQTRQYIRGIGSLAFIQDTLGSTQAGQAQELSKSKAGQDHFILPTLSLVYSDLDNYQLPEQGNFLRSYLRMGSGASQFIQPALEADSFLTPWKKDEWKLTILLQNRAGISYGDVPFYRGFLNAQSWFVRGATQFSIFDESSIKLTQEARLIYQPQTHILGLKIPDFFKDWGAYTTFFVDEGAYWNRQNGLSGDKWQIGAGMGLNLFTPTGLTLGLDLTLPVFPTLALPTFFVRLNSGFFLHADTFITEGFFKR